MTMQDIKYIGQGGSGLNDKLGRALKELQREKVTMVDGGAANATLTLAGITAKDTVFAVINFTDAANITEAPVLAAGTIRFPTVNTTGKKLQVFWYDKE